MKWIDTSDFMPNEEEYVLIFIEGYVGISRLIDGEWDVGDFIRRPMFNKTNRIMSKLEAQYWMPLPTPPEQAQDQVELESTKDILEQTYWKLQS